MTGLDLRTEQVAALLRAEAVPVTGVRVAGQQHEIAVLECAAALLPRLTRLAPAIKALGFRYVALDLRHAGSIDD